MASEDAATVDLSSKGLTKIPEELLLKCYDVRILDLSGNYAICLDTSLKKFINVTQLRLNSCGLLGIPDEISELTKLEELDLSYNVLSSGVNNALVTLGRLKKLNLCHCELTRLHYSIGDLQHLEELDLSYNVLSSGVSNALVTLGRLKKLNLCHCKLTSLPHSIGDLHHLEELDFSYNVLSSTVNAALVRLGRLKKLNFRWCQLTSLPDWIGDLQHLEELDLSRNDLSSGVNAALGRLGRLKKLNLRCCQLTCLPDSIGDLQHLDDLHLSYNDLSSGVNAALGRLGRLKKLNLRFCKLTSLPDSIGDLQHLEELRLSYNDMSSGVNAALGRLGRLKKLNLDRCDLRSLPDSIGDLQHLEELDLNDNYLSSGVNAALGRLGRLKKLNLRGCQLASLPDSIGDLQHLEELDLNDNDLSSGVNAALGRLGRLKKLNLRWCQLTSLPDSIGELQHLEELDLSRIELSSGVNAALGRLGRLKKLNLCHCKLTSLPDSIGDLQHLEELDLEHNDLSSGVNAALGRLGRLKKLNLCHCKLTSLPDSIGDLQHLTDLTLDGNELSEYPRCTIHLENLQRFSVENNCITSLPVELAVTNLRNLNLDGNPIKDPAREIWTQGIQAVKSYMRAVIPGGEIFYADTLNMIGDTCAGKTSVAQSLIEQSPKPTRESDRTRVLQQLRMAIGDNSGHSVIINDFGGHEIYHSVMPIFLPTNGLLILVYNMMDKSHEEAVRKWMFTAIAKSKKLRLIIVGTHAELLADGQRLVLEKQMVKFSSEVLEGAIEEVGYHENHLKPQRRDTDVSVKLTSLGKLRKNLKKSQVHVVALSCSVPDEGLSALRDVVMKLLRPPVTLPIRWRRVIDDIKSLKCICITMKQVADICKIHFTNSDDSNALTTILSYLAKSSQIIWLENHPVLGETIFHSPQKIIDTCKKILHHNNFEHNVPLLYKEKLEQYEKGVLLEPLLWQLLSAATESVNGAASDDVSESQLFNDIVNFLEQFSLISYVRKLVDCKQFIVPCKLTSSEPEMLQDLEEMEKACLNRVTVRLSFVGSIIPMSLFETSLSSMLTVAGELSKHVTWPEVWKDGAIVLHNGVFFYTKRKDAVIILTAFSQPQDPSPWTILHPILKHLNDNVIALWHGAPPSCAIPCPWCARQDRRSGGTSQAAEIALNLKTLVAGDDQSNDRPMCGTCKKAIPRSLCSPTIEYGYSSNDQNEIDEFFGKLGVQGPILSSITSKWSPSALDGMELQQLERNFRGNYTSIITQLTLPVVKEIVRLLYSKALLIVEEKQKIELVTNTATEAATILIDYILTKNEKRLYCAFIEILHTTMPCHGDLITALTS